MPIALWFRRTSGGGRGQIALYFGLAYLLYYLCTPTTGLASVAVQWLLKNGLNLPAQKVAAFQLVIAVPTYVAFLFGLARDRWSFFGRGDQGVLWAFAPLGAMGYFWAATGRPTPLRIIAGILLVVLASRFILASLQGLTASVGQRYAMTGLLSTVWNVVATALVALSYLIGGVVTDHLGYSQSFAMLGVLTFGLFGLGFWRPAAVFGTRQTRTEEGKKTHLAQDVLQIARHRAIWPAVIIWTLWQFAPGMTTPLLFYLTDHLHSTATQFGYFNAVFSISFVPTYLLYGMLCRRVRLRRLLLVGTIFAVPQMIPLLFLHGASQAIWMAVPIGLTGGVATAAYLDLILRSCPKGLEGTAMMIAEAGYFIALRFGDVFGAWLYDQGGFALTAWVTTGVYALILPMLLFVPRAVSDTHDQPGAPADVADEPTNELAVAP
jgi:hypothetical protein